MERRDTGDSMVFVSEWRRSDPEVTRLIDRIRKLVAEQRRTDGRPESERREANRREIDRLQRRLAIAVKRELTG
jgi:hypothetical protein